MPWSIFVGRPSPAPGEPLWLEDDRTKALGYMAWLVVDEAQRCPQCGTKETDWAVRDENGKLVELRDPLYVARVKRCGVCADLEDVREDLDDGQRRDGRRVALVANDPNADAGASPDGEPVT